MNKKQKAKEIIGFVIVFALGIIALLVYMTIFKD